MSLRYFFATEFGAGILNQLQYVPRAMLFMLVLVPAFLYVTEHFGNIKLELRVLARKHWLVLFLFYLSYLLVSTVFGRNITYPLDGIFDHFGFCDDKEWNAEIIQNVIFFVPYTVFFLNVGNNRKPFFSSLILSLTTSCTIEILQLVLWLGYFQISDIVYNSLGGCIGWLLWFSYKQFRESAFIHKAKGKIVSRVRRWLRR